MSTPPNPPTSPVPPNSSSPSAREAHAIALSNTGSPLLSYLHVRFREELGEPASVLVLDSQWSIRSRPEAPAIFVLVNGSYEKPAVWIFDPYAATNVWRTSIDAESEVDVALKEILRRVASAAAAWHPNHASPPPAHE